MGARGPGPRHVGGSGFALRRIRAVSLRACRWGREGDHNESCVDIVGACLGTKGLDNWEPNCANTFDDLSSRGQTHNPHHTVPFFGFLAVRAHYYLPSIHFELFLYSLRIFLRANWALRRVQPASMNPFHRCNVVVATAGGIRQAELIDVAKWWLPPGGPGTPSPKNGWVRNFLANFSIDIGDVEVKQLDMNITNLLCDGANLKIVMCRSLQSL